MKLLAIVTLLAAALNAQQPYTATSGDITLNVMAWSTTNVPNVASGWRPVTVTGTWITACTSNQSTPKLKAIISYKSGADILKLVENFDFLNDGGGTGLRCGNVLPLIKKETIISVSIVTSSTDFADIN
jgi:hypothetical protein